MASGPQVPYNVPGWFADRLRFRDSFNPCLQFLSLSPTFPVAKTLWPYPLACALMAGRGTFKPEKRGVIVNHQDPELKMYAENGLRSTEDWASLGRVVEAGSQPRANTVHRGRAMPLFAREQTAVRPKRDRSAPPVPQVVATGDVAP